VNDETLKALGKLVVGEPPRDAVHIAVIPVKNSSYAELRPGCRVHISYIAGEGATAWEATDYDENEWDGVVDPYLAAPVPEGASFWMFLRPGSITSLRHEWTHPAFPSAMAVPGSRDASEAWLRDYCERYRGDYEEMIKVASTGGYYSWGDDDGPPGYRGTACETEFWMHVEIVCGKRFDNAHREGVHFSCSC
jgi:hypothetical protein